MAAVVVAVVMFDLVGNTDFDGIETMTAGRQRRVEVGELGCMLVGSKLAGVAWERKRVYHRLVEGMMRLL